MRLFGPKREEMGGGRRRLHNEDLQNLGGWDGWGM